MLNSQGHSCSSQRFWCSHSRGGRGWRLQPSCKKKVCPNQFVDAFHQKIHSENIYGGIASSGFLPFFKRFYRFISRTDRVCRQLVYMHHGSKQQLQPFISGAIAHHFIHTVWFSGWRVWAGCMLGGATLAGRAANRTGWALNPEQDGDNRKCNYGNGRRNFKSK